MLLGFFIGFIPRNLQILLLIWTLFYFYFWKFMLKLEIVYIVFFLPISHLYTYFIYSESDFEFHNW